jgi:enamine deaminase RidA (YjgF/YER057c/UK114 family)
MPETIEEEPMTDLLERVETADHDDRFNMPYSAGIKITGGHIVFLAGVTAAPVYHSHPHVSSEFDGIPADPARQTEMAIENLRTVIEAAGGDLSTVVEVTRYIVEIDVNQDAINRAMGAAFGTHRPATTTVEVVRLATDPRLVLELKAVAVVPA